MSFLAAWLPDTDGLKGLEMQPIGWADAHLGGAMQGGPALDLVEDLADGVIAQLGCVKGADDLHRICLLSAAAQAAYHCLGLSGCELGGRRACCAKHSEDQVCGYHNLPAALLPWCKVEGVCNGQK